MGVNRSYGDLGGIVSHELCTWLVVELEVFLRSLVKKPEVAHFHRSRPLSLDGDIYYSIGRCIVDVYQCLRLRMA